MPSCKSSDSARVKPWLAHTPQPDDPPPDQPGEPDVPPIGDPPPQPGEVPRSVRQYDASRTPSPANQYDLARHAGRPAPPACVASRYGQPLQAAPATNAAWTRWARWVGWVVHVGGAGVRLRHPRTVGRS